MNPFEFTGLAPITLSTLIIALAVLAWDVLLAGWIASRREAPRPFTALTGFCGLLVAPALVVSIATGTEAGSRTVSGISWLLPAIACAFVVQVLYSMAMRLLSSVVAVPLLLYNIAVAAVAVGDYMVARTGTAPLALQGVVAARDVLIGMTVGRAALVSPLALLVPMIAPAYPARWRLSAVVRAMLVLAATGVTTLLLIEWPRGVGAVRSYASALSVPMQARPAGDFVIGMRLFPVIDGPPLGRVVTADLALATQLVPEIVLVSIDEDGARAGALDSLARVLEPLREDSVRIAVAMTVSRGNTGFDERNAQLERVLRRIRPDVVFPALLEPVPSLLPRTALAASWWRALLVQSAATVQRVRPRTAVGWAAARLDATDSTVYAWASAPGSPVDLLGAVVYPSFSGLPSVDARLRALDRWHALASVARAASADSTTAARPVRDRPHWLVNIGGLPHAHGDAAQLAALRHSLAWASRRPWVNAAIIGEPADYDGWIGLRAANGRQRAAVSAIALAAKGMREVRPTPAPNAAPALPAPTVPAPTVPPTAPPISSSVPPAGR